MCFVCVCVRVYMYVRCLYETVHVPCSIKCAELACVRIYCYIITASEGHFDLKGHCLEVMGLLSEVNIAFSFVAVLPGIQATLKWCTVC